MTECIKTDEIIPYLTGEIGPEQKRNIEKHLRTCETCQKLIQQCRHAHIILTQYRRDEPPTELYSAYSDELRTIFTTPSRRKKIKAVLASVTIPLTSTKPVFRLGRALAFVLIGVLLGRVLFLNPEKEEMFLPYDVQSYTGITESDLELISTFFVRSELLLLSIQNTSPGQADPADLQLNQTLANELLQQSTQIHRKVNYFKDESLFIFLDQLEVILLDISNRDKAEIRYTFQNLKKLIKDAQLVRHAQEWQKQLQQVSNTI